LRQDSGAAETGNLGKVSKDVTTKERTNIVRFPLLSAGIIGFMSIVDGQTSATLELNLKGGSFKPLTDDQLIPEQKAMVGADNFRRHSDIHSGRGDVALAPYFASLSGAAAALYIDSC